MRAISTSTARRSSASSCLSVPISASLAANCSSQLRGYQLHLVDQGTSPVSLNAAITGLKFFFDVTLDRSEESLERGVQFLRLGVAWLDFQLPPG